jgi:hypothetical protein
MNGENYPRMAREEIKWEKKMVENPFEVVGKWNAVITRLENRFEFVCLTAWPKREI